MGGAILLLNIIYWLVISYIHTVKQLYEYYSYSYNYSYMFRVKRQLVTVCFSYYLAKVMVVLFVCLIVWWVDIFGGLVQVVEEIYL